MVSNVELTLNRIHDRQTIYEQQLLFHRQEIDELKKITNKNTQENIETNKLLFQMLDNVKGDLNKDVLEIRKDFSRMTISSQRWAIGILIGIIIQTVFLMVKMYS